MYDKKQNDTENIHSVGAGLRKNLSKRFVRLELWFFVSRQRT
jgi:hypothetical protein